MAHIKKSQMPKSWPVPRKGGKKRYVAVPSHATSKGISLLFLLRDVLKLVKTRKEARHMTLNGMVKVNNKVRTDENFPVQVFDTVNLDRAKLNYKMEIVNRKFKLVEISAKEAESKIVKIRGKKILKLGVRNKGLGVRGKGEEKFVVQMNLDDGQNFVTKEKFSVGDSVVLNTKEDKIVKILPLKEGAGVEVVIGKHAGEKGTLEGFDELARGRTYKIKLEDKTVSLPYKTILVIA